MGEDQARRGVPRMARISEPQDVASEIPLPIGCAQGTGFSRRRYRGALSLGYFSLGKQRKVTRLPGRAPALYTINTYKELLNITNHQGQIFRGHGTAPTSCLNQ